MNHVNFMLLTVILVSCSSISNDVVRTNEKLKDSSDKRSDSAKDTIDKGLISAEYRTLDISYAAISCPCAQWYETKDANKEGNEKEHIYLESGNERLIQADTLFNGDSIPIRILVSGQFYAHKGYPKKLCQYKRSC